MKKTLSPLFHFVRGDIDGFFGLFIDNLFQLMVIAVLCRTSCGFPEEFITERILPGAALSILIGNLFYAWQARRLAARTHRNDVTALPFGLNTVSLMAFIYLVMAPIYYETGDPEIAWKGGLAACMLSGLIECAGAFVGEWVRRNTPRPALLAPLAGVGLSFMVLGFSFQAFASPLVAIVPMMLILILYTSRARLPLRLPGGLLAVTVGVIAAWLLRSAGLVAPLPAGEFTATLSWNWPVPALEPLFWVFTQPTGWAYVAVVVPVGVFNVINSIQNLESAEAEGDTYPSKPSLLVNGGTSLLAGLFGSPFPTSIYIGHPGWKKMGARTGYSVLSGVVVALICVTGVLPFILRIIPLEASLGVLLWVGAVIVSQAFERTDDRYSVAVVIGLIPPLAAWALHIIETTLRGAGSTLFDASNGISELYIHGIISLYQGFLLISMLLAAILANVIDREFLKAAWWSVAAAVFSAVGLIHSYSLTPEGIQNHFGLMAAPEFVAVYVVLGAMLLGLHYTAIRLSTKKV